MKKIAVILAGCGHLDGAQIRESVITLLELDKAGADFQCFAPDILQHHVVNHLTGQETTETRNVLVEAARIARGKIKPLSEARASDFAAIIMPGGGGAAKNLSDLAFAGAKAKVIPELKELLSQFLEEKKPIGAICISPAILVSAIADKISPMVTIGDDNDKLIESLGGKHKACATSDIIIDEKNKIVTCCAYMRDDPFKDIATGIAKLVKKIVEMIA